jgi:6-phosphogluconolactonase
MTVEAGEPEVRIVPDADAALDLASELIAAALVAAVGARGRADWATTGGSTAPGIYRRLAARPLRGRVPWPAVHAWWGDDRFVPRDHPLSNVLPLDAALVGSGAFSGQSGTGESGIDIAAGLEDGVMLPVENVHPIPVAEAIGEGRDAAWAAAQYDAALHAAAASGVIKVVDGWPAFDLVILGIGPDGHLLSVFPNSGAWDAAAWAVAVPAPTHVEPHVARVTLNPRMLAAVPQVLVVAVGESKAEPVGRTFGEPVDVRALPAQAARRSGATWVLDRAAAARLPNAPPAGRSA